MRQCVNSTKRETFPVKALLSRPDHVSGACGLWSTIPMTCRHTSRYAGSALVLKPVGSLLRPTGFAFVADFLAPSYLKVCGLAPIAFSVKDALDYFSIPPAVPEQPYHSGCTLLWQAVLMDCFDCQFDQSKAGRKQATWDRAWVVSPSEEPYSFAWLCQQLGFDPQVTRAAYLNGAPFAMRRSARKRQF
jgi:hypothetical protein